MKRIHVEWNVYIVRCADDTFYTGICLDIERRIYEHNHDDTLGARYTRSRRPVILIHSEKSASRSEAAKREREIKSLSRIEKQALIRTV
jgi:putative endonuclease